MWTQQIHSHTTGATSNLVDLNCKRKYCCDKKPYTPLLSCTCVLVQPILNLYYQGKLCSIKYYKVQPTRHMYSAAYGKMVGDESPVAIKLDSHIYVCQAWSRVCPQLLHRLKQVSTSCYCSGNNYYDFRLYKLKKHRAFELHNYFVVTWFFLVCWSRQSPGCRG